MTIRTSIGGLLPIVLLLFGVVAWSEAAQQSQDTAMNASNSSATAYNVSTDVFGGVAHAGNLIVWGGIAAVVVVALGVLVTAGGSGR